MRKKIAFILLPVLSILWSGCGEKEVSHSESESKINEVMFEKIKESKEAYIAEFQKTSDLEQQKELIFQFLVDMCRIGLEVNSSIQILATGDDAIFEHPAVFQNLHSQCIDYVKELNVLDIYEAADVPITRDFPDYKPDES
jgi:hypothetical protein